MENKQDTSKNKYDPNKDKYIKNLSQNELPDYISVFREAYEKLHNLKKFKIPLTQNEIRKIDLYNLCRN